MKTLFIAPIDVIFFRDGRSFSAGADHEAQTLFPPLPASFYGAIRSAMLSQKNAQFSKNGFLINDATASQEVGTATKLGTLQIQFFSLARIQNGAVEALFPIPFDVLKQKKAKPAKLTLISPQRLPAGIKANFPISSMQFLWSVHSENEFYENESGFLSLNAFQRYLEGKAPNESDIISPKNIYEKEPRTGIRLKASKTTGEGQLFSVEFIRLQDGVGFLLSLENADSLSDNGLLRIGGEGKAASYKTANVPSFDKVEEIQKKVEAQKKFKIVLFTPAVFKEGWIPDGIDSKTGEGSLFSCKVKLIGASVGRFITVGGWDIAKNRPKPTYRAVPAGSAYFFELLEGDAKTLLSYFGKSILADDWAKQGFGISYIGAIS